MTIGKERSKVTNKSAFVMVDRSSKQGLAMLLVACCSVASALASECDAFAGRECTNHSRASLSQEIRVRSPAARLDEGEASAGWSLKPLVGTDVVTDTTSALSTARITPRQQLNRHYARRSALKDAKPVQTLMAVSGVAGEAAAGSDEKGLCMSPPRNGTLPAVQAGAVGDECRFAPAEERWGPSCSDPYFGGSFSCCFHAKNGTCSLCLTQKQCASKTVVQCAER